LDGEVFYLFFVVERIWIEKLM